MLVKTYLSRLLRCVVHPGQQKYPIRSFAPTKAEFRRRNVNEGIKKLILDFGPVVATIHYPDDWQNPNQPHIYKADCSGDPDHSVTIIGYGKEKDQEFWLIKNSHGDQWADGGYIRLGMRDDNDNKDCGLKKNIVYLRPL